MFASVSTRKQQAQIVIRHYKKPTETKGGRVVPTQKCVSLDLKSFQRLVYIQKKLVEDYHQQTTSLALPADSKGNMLVEETQQGQQKEKKRRRRNKTCQYISSNMDEVSKAMEASGIGADETFYQQEQPAPCSSTLEEPCYYYCPSFNELVPSSEVALQ